MTQRRILVVDDCVDTVDLLKATLEGEYEVYGLRDPAKVFDAVELAQPDAVILDLMMPGLSGFDILELKGATPAAIRSTPFIVLSCKRAVEDQKKAYELGAKLYCSKPFDPDRLLKLLKTFFDGEPVTHRPKMLKLGEVDKMLHLRGRFMVSQLGRGAEMRGAATAADHKKRDAKGDDAEVKKAPERWLN